MYQSRQACYRRIVLWLYTVRTAVSKAKIVLGRACGQGPCPSARFVFEIFHDWIRAYHFSSPATKKIEMKKTYLIRIGDYYVGVGAYVGS